MHAVSSMDTSCSTLPGASSNTLATPSCNPSSRAADAVIVVATSAMVTSSAGQRLGTDDFRRLRLQWPLVTLNMLTTVDIALQCNWG